VKWLDTAPPVQANNRSLMVLNRDDKVTQPRQATAELQEGMFRKALDSARSQAEGLVLLLIS
jgi:hypothetical protein